MRNRFGISADFAGEGAGVCWEVMAGNGMIRRSQRNGLRRGVFPALVFSSACPFRVGAFFDYAV